MEIDLHIHTTASDGLYTPAEVVEMACAAGLRVVSICDHDTVDGLAEAFRAAEGTDLELIPGVEVSADADGLEVHILGYFVDQGNSELRTALARFRESRLQRAREMLARLEALGVPLSWDRVQELAREGTLGRVHIAEAMREARYVASSREAFERYVGHGRPAYVRRLRVSAVEAMRLIYGAGGLPVLAHPWDLLPIVPGLPAEGLAGLEVYYTGYSRAMTARLCVLAREHDLVCTGGSDFHGLALLPDNPLGGVRVPAGCVEALRRRWRLLCRAG